MDHEPKRHLSMFRSFVLADLITLANASCGMAAVLLCLNHVSGERTPYLWVVFILSRWQSFSTCWTDTSPGNSRGIQPWGLTLIPSRMWSLLAWPRLFSDLLWACGACGMGSSSSISSPAASADWPGSTATAAQLADEKGKVKYYQGTPITTSIIIVAILGIAYWLGRVDDLLPLGFFYLGPWRLHLLSILYAVNGSTMISGTIRIPKP